MEKIKIFLVSRENLTIETPELPDLLEHLNLILEKQDIRNYLWKWKYLQSKEDKDNPLDRSDRSLVIFGNDFVSYSEEDLKKVYDRVCKEGANPQKLYVCFKTGDDQIEALKKFRDSFPEQFGHLAGNSADINAFRADLILMKEEIENLKTELETYRLRIQTLENDKPDGWLQEIIDLCKKILEQTVTLYGDMAVETVETRHALAQAYASNDNYKESEKEYLIVLSNLEIIGKLNTLLHAEILRELGKMHLTNEMFLKGKPYIEQALEIMEDKYDCNNIIFVKALQDLSIFYSSMDMFEEAIDASTRALTALERIPEPDLSLYNSIKRTLAYIYLKKETLIKVDDNEYTTKKDDKDTEKALKLFKEIYESEKEDKEASITNLCNIGHFFRKNCGWPLKNNPTLLEAAEYYKKALGIAKEIKDKRASKEILQFLGEIYEFIGTKEEAEKLGYTYPPSEPKNEKKFADAYADYQKNQNDIANEIAALYLEKYPRKEYFGVTLSSIEDDSEGTFYYELSNEEIEAIQEYSNISEEEGIPIDEILCSENPELAEKLLDHGSPMPLDIVASVDLEHPLKFTRFSFQELPQNDKSGYEKNINVDLTDDEYKEILVELLLNSNLYSMNMLVYRKPEIAQKIIRHLTWASTGTLFENYNPFICDMVEQKEICESILNPFKDILELFECKDESVRKFVEKHQMVPECRSNDSLFDYEIYSDDDTESLDSYHVLMHFIGRKILISQEGVTRISGRFHDVDRFIVDVKDIIKKFGLNSPEEIFPYLRANFNSSDCFYRLYKEFHLSDK